MIRILEHRTVMKSVNDSIFSYFAWPTVARLQDGRLAAASSGFRYAHVCPFGKAVISYSADEGKTWTVPAPVIDTPLDDRDAGLLAFGDNKVILTSFNNTAAEQREWAAARKTSESHLIDADLSNRAVIAMIEAYIETITPEIEKKYLIKMPNLDMLKEKYNAVKSEIIQVYLNSENENEEVRIRQRGDNGSYTYYLTKKIKRDDMSRYEVEEKISKDRYLNLLMNADITRNILKKTRYCFMYENQYFELDSYPFSSDKAILEIELTDKNSKITLPSEISVIKDVTDDERYKNSSIAKDNSIFLEK